MLCKQVLLSSRDRAAKGAARRTELPLLVSSALNAQLGLTGFGGIDTAGRIG